MPRDGVRRRTGRAGYLSRLFVIGLALALTLHASAGADTYSVVEGSLSLDETGRTDDLEGRMHLSVLGSLRGDPLQVVWVNSFFLGAGENTFEPAGLPQYGGLPVIHPWALFPLSFLLPSSRILLEDDDVKEMLLTAGGEPFDSDSDQVTFRFHDFVVDESEHASRGFLPMNLPGRRDDDGHESEEHENEDENDDGHDEDGHDDDEDEVDEAGLPRELEAEGRLFAWERTYAILTAEECRGQSPLPPFEPPGDGAVIIGLDLGDLEILIPSLPRPSPARPLPLAPGLSPPASTRPVLIRPGGAVLTIGPPPGDLEISIPSLPRPLPLAPGLSLPARPRPLPVRPGGAVLTIGPPPGDLETSAPILSRPALGTRRPLGLVSWSQFPVSPDFIDGPIGILDFLDRSTMPSLAQLQMEAPQGADMSFDASGVLTVSTDGDLYWSGALDDVPGLTRLEIYAANIYVTGEILLPPDTTFLLNAIDQIVIGSPPGDIDPPSPPPDGLEEGCLLARSQSAPREIGSFKLKAVRDRGVEIEADRSETRRGRHGRQGRRGKGLRRKLSTAH